MQRMLHRVKRADAFVVILRNRPFLWLFLAALALRFGATFAVNAHPVWDGVIYERAATELVLGHGYTLRALRATAPLTPSAFYPVGWPAALALMRLTVPIPAHLIDLIFQCVVGALLAPLTMYFAREHLSERRAVGAGIAMALWPSGIFLCATWLGDQLFTLLLLAATTAISRTHQRYTQAMLGGALFGAAALVRPTGLVIAVAFGCWFASQRRFGFAALFAVSVALTIAPWTIRNMEVLHAPVLISTNGGANLLVGTLGDGTYGHIDSAHDCPNGRPEVERDQCRAALARGRIAAAPFDAALRTFSKLAHTFGYETSAAQAFGVSARVNGLPLAVVSSLFYLSACCLALIGMRNQPKLKAILAITVSSVAVVHAVYLGGDRYHLPLIPFIVTCALAFGQTRATMKKVSSLVA